MNPVLASYSLNHPTLPDIRVKVFETSNPMGPFVVTEYRSGLAVSNHYFPHITSVRDIKKMARELLQDLKRKSQEAA